MLCRIARGHPQSFVRPLQVRAFKEEQKDQNQQAALQRQEQAAPSALARPSTAPRLPSLFREMEREMDALSRSFFGGDLMMRSPFDMLSAFRDMPAPELELDLPTMRLATDVSETDAAYELKADIPGMRRKDIQIKLTPDRVLQITGERKDEKVEEAEGSKRVERRFGRFSRAFVLPKNVSEEGIKAEAQDGVLTITLPKAQVEEPQPRDIPVA